MRVRRYQTDIKTKRSSIKASLWNAYRISNITQGAISEVSVSTLALVQVSSSRHSSVSKQVSNSGSSDPILFLLRTLITEILKQISYIAGIQNCDWFSFLILFSWFFMLIESLGNRSILRSSLHIGVHSIDEIPALEF